MKQNTVEELKGGLARSFEALGLPTPEAAAEHWIGLAIEAHEREQWGSVDDPPAESGKYITNVGVCGFMPASNYWTQGDYYTIRIIPKVWRPLPTPPQEEL